MIETNRAHSTVLLSTWDEDRLIETVEAAREAVGGRSSCVFAFTSTDWKDRRADLVEILQVHGHAPVVAGCSADGIIGTGREDENVSGCALQFLNLPNTEVRVSAIEPERVDRAQGEGYWHGHTGVEAEAASGWILLANPVEFDVEQWLRTWNAAYSGVPCFGGLASGGGSPDDLFVFGTAGESDAGGLAVSFSGGVRFGGVVSQGCRPIGEPWPITAARDNVVFKIGTRQAYEVLEETFGGLSDEDKLAAQHNILAGLAISEYVDEFHAGDFLVRNILGGDPDAGALALGAFPREGQTLQFQMRDRDAADDELRRLCMAVQQSEGEPFAGLMFSCTGRGSRMFGVPNHDAGVVEEVFGKVPLAGFFGNGEIGPVGGTTFLHGYTASAALLF